MFSFISPGIPAYAAAGGVEMGFESGSVLVLSRCKAFGGLIPVCQSEFGINAARTREKEQRGTGFQTPSNGENQEINPKIICKSGIIGIISKWETLGNTPVSPHAMN